jgi:hypothetical protein
MKMTEDNRFVAAVNFEEDEYERNSSVGNTCTTHPPSPKLSMFSQALSNREPLLNKVLE